jgi:hypothetical protein
MTMHLVEIKLLAVVSDGDLVSDRLNIDGVGCPLNLLPRLVRDAEAWGDETSACPHCGGDKAVATVLREATAHDLINYTWRTPGEGP